MKVLLASPVFDLSDDIYACAVSLEWTWQDLWVGLFVKSSDYAPTLSREYVAAYHDAWICLIPMLPIHVEFTTRKPVDRPDPTVPRTAP